MRILSVSQNFIIAATALVLLCCQKENSSIGTGTADGTLKHLSGVCTQVTIGGTYTQGVPLSSSNTVTVEVTVTTPGTYNITTNTINGVSFSMSGTFTGTGVKSVILIGSGTPVNTGSNNYPVLFGSSTCDFSITFAAGTSAATGTLGGSAGSCTPVIPAGTYTQGVALISANTVQVQVNIITQGTYTISTNTVNGVNFSATGTFTNTGVQNIILAGTGTPANAGSQMFTVTFGNSSCTYLLTFLPLVSTATGTLAGSPAGCSPVITSGIYTQGLALTAANTAQVQVNVATAETYTISTSIGNGISFSKSGTFTATGLQNVVLTGTGIPGNASSQNYTVTFGTSVCNFSIAFGAGGSANDHFPTTINSYWVYGFGPGPGVGMGDGLRINVVSGTLTAGGNTYSTFNVDDSTNHYQFSLYYRKAGGEYFEYINTKSFFGLDGSGTPPNMDYTFMKDNVPQGSTWNSSTTTGTMGGTPYSIYMKMTILEKGVTSTISAVTFNDVIKVRYEGIATTAQGTFTEFTIERWFAKNIGEIYHSFHDGVSQFDYYRIANYQVF